MMKALPAVLLFGLLSTLLIGCGYQLRDTATLSEHYRAIYVQNMKDSDPVYVALARYLRHSNARLVKEPTEATAFLVIERNEIRERVAVVDPRATAREFELTQVIDFYVEFKDGRKLAPRSLTASRAYDYDSKNVLSFVGNEQQARNELADTMARLIYYRLATDPERE